MKLEPRLAALVVKDGVSLGLLGEADRSLVLALAATAIEAGREHRDDYLFEKNARALRTLLGVGG